MASHQLLSVLGHKFDFGEFKKTGDQSVVEELAFVENWISDRLKTVFPLKELAALQVRRYAAKQEVNQLIKVIEVPREIEDLLFLKCFESDLFVKEQISVHESASSALVDSSDDDTVQELD